MTMKSKKQKLNEAGHLNRDYAIRQLTDVLDKKIDELLSTRNVPERNLVNFKLNVIEKYLK